MSARQSILDRLSERVRYYSLARTVGDALLEEQNRVEVASLVESLLGNHLRGGSAWEGTWVETFVPVELTVSHANIAVSGVAVWSGRMGAFLEPLLATFELTADLESVRSYALRFGDAELGLGTIRYEPNAMSRVPPRPRRWCFEFNETR